MTTELRTALADWDFAHAREPFKVYVSELGKWCRQCRCGDTFESMADFYQHRIDQAVHRVTAGMVREDMEARIQSLLPVKYEPHQSQSLKDAALDERRALARRIAVAILGGAA